MQSQNEVITKRQTMIYYRRTDSTMTMKKDRQWSTIEEQTVQWQWKMTENDLLSKNRQYNDKMKKDRQWSPIEEQTVQWQNEKGQTMHWLKNKRKDNNLPNTKQITKDRATPIHWKRVGTQGLRTGEHFLLHMLETRWYVINEDKRNILYGNLHWLGSM
jgi:hypothetical protein